MSLSDIFCVERHKSDFIYLVKNKLDIVFANEQEIFSLIKTNSFNEVISFCKNLDNNIVITRGSKGAVSINNNQVFECSADQNLKIKDLTGAGDLFAAGYLHGVINNLTLQESLAYGTKLSSKVIQQVGARIILN